MERQSTSGPRGSNGIVLVADDEKNVRTPIVQFLLHADFRVVEAEDGEAAVALAIEHVPTVILLDVKMPKLSGIAAAKLIRQRSELVHIPILLMSGSPLPGIRDTAYRIGCVDYLAKPYSPLALVAVVEHWAKVGIAGSPGLIAPLPDTLSAPPPRRPSE